jgi:hypothetical protein
MPGRGEPAETGADHHDSMSLLHVSDPNSFAGGAGCESENCSYNLLG